MNLDQALKAIDNVDERIIKLVTKLAGDKLDNVTVAATEHILNGKQPERALADALEQYKLV